MTRALLALAALAFAFPASADCVWTSLGAHAAKVVCGDADEVAPSAATEGFALDPGGAYAAKPRGIVVTACADATRTLTSGTVKAYTYDSASALWARAPELDLTVSESGNRCVSWSGMTVTVPKGRIAWIPSVVVVSAGGFTAYLTASP